MRDGVKRGRIRSSVRIWQSPRVKVGNKYAIDDGHIVIDSIDKITRKQITYDLARCAFTTGPQVRGTRRRNKYSQKAQKPANVT
ncbi:MAG: hypothetical protein K2Y23_19285 [Cyanobacteria bacterium]|nr:hypothetical protein [Cyanobacteriota bacterium]